MSSTIDLIHMIRYVRKLKVSKFSRTLTWIVGKSIYCLPYLPSFLSSTLKNLPPPTPGALPCRQSIAFELVRCPAVFVVKKTGGPIKYQY